MSGLAMKWARRQLVGGPALKAVLNAIAARVGPQGTTYVAQATLAADLGMGERTVRRHLAMLSELGVITRQVRSNGRKGRLSDLIGLSTHREFRLSDKDIGVVKLRLERRSIAVRTESSNRPLTTVTTGQRWPGNSKRITCPNHERAAYQGVALGGRPSLKVVAGSSIDMNFYDDQEVGF